MTDVSIKLNRGNRELDVAVNKGLAAALLRNRSVGIKTMLEAGVPQNVVTRVLMGSPDAHRATDWK